MIKETFYGTSVYTQDQLSGTLLDSLFNGSFDSTDLAKNSIRNTWENLSPSERLYIQKTSADLPLSRHEQSKLSRELLYFIYVNERTESIRKLGTIASGT